MDVYKQRETKSSEQWTDGRVNSVKPACSCLKCEHGGLYSKEMWQVLYACLSHDSECLVRTDLLNLRLFRKTIYSVKFLHKRLHSFGQYCFIYLTCSVNKGYIFSLFFLTFSALTVSCMYYSITVTWQLCLQAHFSWDKALEALFWACGWLCKKRNKIPHFNSFTKCLFIIILS